VAQVIGFVVVFFVFLVGGAAMDVLAALLAVGLFVLLVAGFVAVLRWLFALEDRPRDRRR
jgi:O-antigen/teichoic acid export membrane protein